MSTSPRIFSHPRSSSRAWLGIDSNVDDVDVNDADSDVVDNDDEGSILQEVSSALSVG